jgi:hypothetical protein
MSAILFNRTFHPKYTTFGGDGSGRNNYIFFDNGGLHNLRVYQGSKHRAGSFIANGNKIKVG